jgi:hypothetical protein
MRTGRPQPASYRTATQSARIGGMRSVITRWCSTMGGTVPARRADPRRWVRPCPKQRSGCFPSVSLATGAATRSSSAPLRRCGFDHRDRRPVLQRTASSRPTASRVSRPLGAEPSIPRRHLPRGVRLETVASTPARWSAIAVTGPAICH